MGTKIKLLKKISLNKLGKIASQSLNKTKQSLNKTFQNFKKKRDEEIAKKILNLPIYPQMKKNEISYVANALIKLVQ